ncbi:MAG: GDP-mannose 4,6-dehydratase [Bryobacteraceae bacterium]
MSIWRDRGVFVTGGSGLLGSALVRRLTGLGARVVCLIRDWVPESELMRTGTARRVTIVRGDLCEEGVAGRVLNEHEIATVFHLGAQTIVGVANRNPASTFETNIGGTWKLLEACRRTPVVRQVLVASSDKAYGAQLVLPYEEETPLAGRHPYDVSKSCADLIAQSYAVSYGLPVAITRCGNLFGGGDLNWNRIVPGTIRSLARGERPVIRSDGEFIRDYFYVEDAVSAYLLLAEALSDGRVAAGEAFNFSNETPVTVLELVARIGAAMGASREPEILNQASNEIRAQYLSARKARERLGWKPGHTLEQGLRETIEWYRQMLGVASPAGDLEPVESSSAAPA